MSSHSNQNPSSSQSSSQPTDEKMCEHRRVAKRMMEEPGREDLVGEARCDECVKDGLETCFINKRVLKTGKCAECKGKGDKCSFYVHPSTLRKRSQSEPPSPNTRRPSKRLVKEATMKWDDGDPGPSRRRAQPDPIEISDTEDEGIVAADRDHRRCAHAMVQPGMHQTRLETRGTSLRFSGRTTDASLFSPNRMPSSSSGPSGVPPFRRRDSSSSSTWERPAIGLAGTGTEPFCPVWRREEKDDVFARVEQLEAAVEGVDRDLAEHLGAIRERISDLEDEVRRVRTRNEQLEADLYAREEAVRVWAGGKLHRQKERHGNYVRQLEERYRVLGERVERLWLLVGELRDPKGKRRAQE